MAQGSAAEGEDVSDGITVWRDGEISGSTGDTFRVKVGEADRSEIEAVVLEVMECVASGAWNRAQSRECQLAMELLVNSATREREEAQAEALDTENANRPRDKPETGTVTTESPDTGDEADAGEDGPVEGASESDVDPDTIPAELVRELDRALMAWSVRVLGGNKLSKEVKQDWNELVAPQWGVISHALDLSPPKPHGTVNAHLAEQMEDPEFRAEYEAEGEKLAPESIPAEPVRYLVETIDEWQKMEQGRVLLDSKTICSTQRDMIHARDVIRKLLPPRNSCSTGG